MRLNVILLTALAGGGALPGQGIPTEAKVNELQTRLTQTETARLDLMNQLAVLQDRLAASRKEVAGHRAQLREAEVRVAAMDGRLAALDTTRAELVQRQRIADLEAELAQQKERLHASHPLIRRAETKLKVERESLDQMCARRTLAEEVRAVIQETVDGQPHLAEASLREALAIAGTEDRPPLLVRQAILLERSRRTAEARETLRELRNGPAPYANWAQSRLDRMDVLAAETKGATDGLMQLIRRLDGRWSEPVVVKAWEALRELGPLAVPSMLAALDTLGPWGQRHALLLLARYPDHRVVDAVKKRLLSNDSSAQVLGAEALAHLSPEARASLAEAAAKTTQPFAVVHGARAMARDPDGTAAAIGRIAALVDRGGPELDRLIVETLRQERVLYRQPGAIALAARLAAREVSDAAVAWVELSRPLDSEEALVILRSLQSTDARDRFVQAAMTEIPRDDHQFVLGALEVELGASMMQVCLERVKSMGLVEAGPRLLPLLQGAKASVVASALKVLTDLPGGVPVGRIRHLMFDQPSVVRKAAFECVAKKAPTIINAHAEALLAQPDMWLRTLGVLKNHADEAGVRAAVRSSLQDPSLDRSELDAMVANQSTRKNLPELLDWIAMAAYHENRSWSSRTRAVRQALPRWFGPAEVEPTLRRLHEIDASVARDAIQLVARHATRDHLEAIRKVASSDAADGHLSAEMMPLLARLGDERALLIVRPRLSEPANAVVRAGAWKALSLMTEWTRRSVLKPMLERNPTAEQLEAALKDPVVAKDDALRDLAVGLIGSWTGEPVDATTFISALTPKTARDLCDRLLTRSGDPSPPDPRTIHAVLATLATEKDEALVATLAKGLRHPDSEVRMAIVSALGRSCAMSAVRPLIDTLADDRSSVVTKVEQALDRIRTFHEAKRRWEKWLETGEMPEKKQREKKQREKTKGP